MNSKKTSSKKICVVTGTRAEYGLLSGLMRELDQADDFILQVIACAAHLSERHGMTVNQILADGFKVDARVEMLSDSDSKLAVAQAVARGVKGLAEAYAELNPDLIVVLGDRYEMLAAAQAALLMNIPIAHIHGGEVTQGAVDEAIRHAISKMANLHFAAAEPYRQRLIQMGEQPDRVFNVGSPGLDLIAKTQKLNKTQLAESLHLTLKNPLFLITYHPVTWGDQAGITAVAALFSALEAFPKACLIWTAPNADAEGEALHQQIENWIKNTNLDVHLFTSLGSQRYLSLLALADAVIGNSSSGIIEAPALGTPTVNIGTRQDGRLRAPSIIDCEDNTAAIKAAIEQALSEPHRTITAQKISVYGQGHSAQGMLNVLRKTDLSELTDKPFYDRL